MSNDRDVTDTLDREVARLRAKLAKARKERNELKEIAENCCKPAIARVVELEAQLANASKVIDSWLAEEKLWKEQEAILLADSKRLREALEEYSVHDRDCILAQYRQGRPTADGGYEVQYGYGEREKWYRTRPVDERPKCECGLNAALNGGK